MAAAAVLVIVATACGNPYAGQPNDYGGGGEWVKPTFLSIHMQYENPDPPGAECYLGLATAGVGVIGAVAMPIAGVSAWYVFGQATSAGLGMGFLLGDCWNQYQATRRAFDVYTQCPVNHPVLQTSFNDYGSVVAFVNMQSCYCSFACQLGFEDAPGIFNSVNNFAQGKHYWNDGPNRVNGPTTGDPPPPPDYDAMAAGMGLTYEGCNTLGVGGFHC